MRVVEAATAPTDLTADVCVVGGGPVGLSLSRSLCNRGLRVVLLESGLDTPDDAHQLLSQAEIVSPDKHAPMSLAVCRALGGTSWLWGGRCVLLDPIDFEARSFIPDSGWPISEADIAPYYTEAAELLGCGPGEFVDPERAAQDGNDTVHFDRFERWSNETNCARLLRRDKAPAGLTIVLDATAVDLEFDDGGEHVTGITVASMAGRRTYTGMKTYVLACGGLESARLLLNVQARLPYRFGGQQGALGRYYMGHLSGRIADIKFADPSAANLFTYQNDRQSMRRRIMTLSSAVQLETAIPNVSFYPDNPRMSDPRHRSGMLSAAFLILSVPALGRLVVAEAIRRLQVGNEAQYLAHLRNIVLDLPASALALWVVAVQRFVKKRRKPVFFLAARDGNYPLHYHAEQLPTQESRISLTEERDRFGLRRLSIDLRFSLQDAEGVCRAHEILDKGLRASGIGALTYEMDHSGRCLSVLEQAADGFHQIGVTRMGSHVREGVVDRDCRVLETENLFIAGSSVFRTSGQANPTFPATALALRLSAHLAGLINGKTHVTVP